jgi:carbon starvation protein
MMAFWYHYAILFEALFILTTLDAGTRVARFMLQDMLGMAHPSLARTENWGANVLCTGIAVAGWGWFLYQGVVDPLGGINTLWPLFGIANQMLAGIALVFCCVIMVKMKREKYLWIPLLPTAWLLLCTLTASWQKIFHDDARIGFLASARRFTDAIARGEVVAPAKSIEEMRRLVFNYHVDVVLCAVFIVVVLSTVFFGARAALAARQAHAPTTRESDYVALDSVLAKATT